MVHSSQNKPDLPPESCGPRQTASNPTHNNCSEIYLLSVLAAHAACNAISRNIQLELLLLVDWHRNICLRVLNSWLQRTADVLYRGTNLRLVLPKFVDVTASSFTWIASWIRSICDPYGAWYLENIFIAILIPARSNAALPGLTRRRRRGKLEIDVHAMWEVLLNNRVVQGQLVRRCSSTGRYLLQQRKNTIKLP